MAHWGENEIQVLLTLRAEDAIHGHLSGTVKDGPLFEGLAKKMGKAGFQRTKVQIINKLKSLRKTYHKINDHSGRNGRGRLDWPHFDICQDIGGRSHSENLVGVQGSLDATAAPDAPSPSASTSSRSPEGMPLQRAKGIVSPRRSKTKAEEVQDFVRGLVTDAKEEDRAERELRTAEEAEARRERETLTDGSMQNSHKCS
ncbi:hypothetical protein ACEWY4_018258 [Coilia grayii]|uniref:Myb/SANT-like DNA-binding domain-containing protein n=1 Tax=Coilia grayii TaxID=363190 RepID=A0ABD1JJ65_9TELE